MKKYRIDKTKNIGNVIFVVEGGRPETGGTELRLLKKNTAKLSFKLGQDAKRILANEIYPDESIEKKDVHLKTVDLVFSEKESEAET